MKHKLIVLLAVTIVTLSQIACGNMTSESRTIDSLQTLVDKQITQGD